MRTQIAPSRTTRLVVLTVVGVIFLIPIVAMLEFSLRAGLDGGYNLGHWTAIFDPELLLPPAPGAGTVHNWFWFQ